MKRIEAIQKAEELVKVIKVNTCKIRENEWLSGEEEIPHVFEFLVFGSSARKTDDDEVGDLDMIILDNGYFSHHFDSRNMSPEDDLYGYLRANIVNLLADFFEDYSDPASELMDTPIDLHILPLKFLRKKAYREKVALQHKDPNFFQNCFSSMLRFGQIGYYPGSIRYYQEQYPCGFYPVELSYFEDRYHCKLQDLSISK